MTFKQGTTPKAHLGTTPAAAADKPVALMEPKIEAKSAVLVPNLDAAKRHPKRNLPGMASRLLAWHATQTMTLWLMKGRSGPDTCQQLHTAIAPIAQGCAQQHMQWQGP